MSLQAQEQKMSYNKDLIIGSFSSSIVFLIHTQYDLLENNADELLKKQNYYKSQLNIIKIVNQNFKNSLNEFLIKGNPSKNDNSLLIKLVKFSEIYDKQNALLLKYIETKENEHLVEFQKLHKEMKQNIKELFTNQDKR